MVSFTTIANLALLASSVLALPAGHQELVNKIRAKRVKELQTQVKKGPKSQASQADTGGPGGWAGAAIGGQNGVSTVSATMTVPTPSVPSGGSDTTTYGGTGWVGIDGYGLNVLWQTGVLWTVTGSSTTFYGWWDWCSPDGCGLTQFENWQVSAGDVIAMQVIAGSTTSGTAILENQTTGQTINQTLTGQYPLQQATAEWVLEDYGISGGSVPFAAESPTTFSGVSWTDSAGQGQTLDGTTLLNIQNSNGAFTNTVQNSDTSLTINYICNAAMSG